MGKLVVSFPEIPWYVGVGLVVALCALWVNVRNYRLSSKKAVAERVVRPNLSFVVYSARISGDANYVPPQHIVLACHSTPGRCVDFPFYALIENIGQRTAIDVWLHLRFPKLVSCWTGGHYEGCDSATVTDKGEWREVLLRVGDVHPGAIHPLLDHLSITDALFLNGDGVWTFFVEFRISQRDVVAVEGSISFGLIDVSRASLPDALRRLSRLLPVDKANPRHLLDRTLAMLTSMIDQQRIVGRCVILVSYDKASSVADQGQKLDRVPLDRVPLEALEAQAGVQDRRGNLWFPGVNSGVVTMYTGKVDPEVPGYIGSTRVVNLGVHHVTERPDESPKRGEG